MKVRKASWRKGFPGAKGGKMSSSWPGKEGLEEYSRESERLGLWTFGRGAGEREGENRKERRVEIAEMMSDKLA